jgi:predicted ATP-dependent endonuclease of OLD family
VYANDTSVKLRVGIEADLLIPTRFFVSSRRGGRLLRIREERQIGYVEITLGYRKYRHEIQLISTEFKLPEDGLTLKTKRNRLGRHVVDFVKGLEKLGEERINQMLSVRNLLPTIYPLSAVRSSEESYQKLRKMQNFIRSFREQLNEVEFLGPFRTNPQRLYMLTGESPKNVGRHGERALEILLQDEKRRGKAKKNLLPMLSQWMKEAEIAKSVDTASISDRYFELIIENYHTGEIENLADVGFGCSQVIPVLIAGFNVRENGIFIVEEPEIHLHPKAQAELGSLFYAMYKRGIQLFIETHSEHMLLRIQSHVARGDISAKDVNVFYIDPAGKGKRKMIYRIPIGEDGYFMEEWPKGFFPEKLREAKRLAGLSAK